MKTSNEIPGVLESHTCVTISLECGADGLQVTLYGELTDEFGALLGLLQRATKIIGESPMMSQAVDPSDEPEFMLTATISAWALDEDCGSMDASRRQTSSCCTRKELEDALVLAVAMVPPMEEEIRRIIARQNQIFGPTH